MATLYTIGFTNKSAKEFFGLLKSNKVKKLLDIRLNAGSQLAGFAKGKDLPYFMEEICGAGYEHYLDMAPTKDILDAYRDKKMTWDEYEKAYIELLKKRNIAEKVKVDDLGGACFLCSEHEPQFCHRRLLAEYLQKALKDIEIKHLV